jgi:hypothetical protein
MAKTNKNKPKISDDERWKKYDELKAAGKIIEANKLKSEILDSYRYKKPCHHVAGEVV